MRGHRLFQAIGEVVALGFWLAALAGCGGPAEPRQAPEVDPATKARVAESLFGAGRVSEALETIDEAIALDPDNPTLLHYRGTMLFRSGRLEEAEATFRRVLELDPYFADAHNFLGSVYAELDQPQRAEEEYRTALDSPSYPTPEIVHLNLALLYKRQGRDEDALRQLRTAVEIAPKYYRGYFELASLLDRMGKLDEAARIYQVAEPGYRGSADFYYRMGLAYFRLGEAQKSREALLRALDVAPGSESAARADELLKMLE
jgi:tetratricopeptide (TPR) repeat protein